MLRWRLLHPYFSSPADAPLSTAIVMAEGPDRAPLLSHATPLS